jgi:2-hydroxychromene-2-carboxylate isomerase
MHSIEYFFSIMSTWSYIGHDAFHEVARRHQCGIEYRPISLPRLLAAQDAAPLVQRSAAKQSYRILELQRWRERRGMSFRLRPTYLPADPRLADGIVIAMLAAGLSVEPFIRSAYMARWHDDKDLADGATLEKIVDSLGLSGDEWTRSAQRAPVRAVYEANLARALEIGVFGAPTYVLKGELFWGQDRLDMLDEALSSGRPQFIASAIE